MHLVNIKQNFRHSFFFSFFVLFFFYEYSIFAQLWAECYRLCAIFFCSRRLYSQLLMSEMGIEWELWLGLISMVMWRGIVLIFYCYGNFRGCRSGLGWVCGTGRLVLKIVCRVPFYTVFATFWLESCSTHHFRLILSKIAQKINLRLNLQIVFTFSAISNISNLDSYAEQYVRYFSRLWSIFSSFSVHIHCEFHISSTKHNALILNLIPYQFRCQKMFSIGTGFAFTHTLLPPHMQIIFHFYFHLMTLDLLDTSLHEIITATVIVIKDEREKKKGNWTDNLSFSFDLSVRTEK